MHFGAKKGKVIKKSECSGHSLPLLLTSLALWSRNIFRAFLVLGAIKPRKILYQILFLDPHLSRNST